MVQVFAEHALLDQVVEIAVGGDDHAHVDRDGAIAADAFHLAFLEHAQEFGLHEDRHVADLVEEQGAVVGLLELADVAGGGAGEAAFFVAEEFAFDQLGGHRGAVQGDERPAFARAALVQGARDQLFAGAGLAEDADARFAGRHAVHLRHHAPHALAGVHDFVFADALAQVAILVFQALELEDVVHGEQQLVGGERLLQEIERAEAGGADRHFDIGLPADHHDGKRDAEGTQVFEQGEAVLARHDDVAEHHVEGLRFGQFEGARGVIADGGFVPGEAEGARQRGQRVGVVVNDQEVCHRSYSGSQVRDSSMRKVEPVPFHFPPKSARRGR